MKRLIRPLALVALAASVAACDVLPTAIGGETLHGEVSGTVTAKTKIAVVPAVGHDFTQATVVPVSQRKFSYKLPDNEPNLFVAAFEDLDDNGKWSENEPISFGDANSSYLKLSKISGTWQVSEQSGSGPKPTSLADSTITFNA